MKKNLMLVIMVAFAFALVGCGSVDVADNNNVDDNTVEENQNVNNTNTDDEIKLYSDSTKYVFEYGNIKYVYYYSGDEITAFHTYVKYEDASTAIAANNLLKTQDLENVDKHYVKGKYIVFEYSKEEYEDMKASELKAAYSYMKELKEN